MALKLLEDLGCEVVDNIPIALCDALIAEKRIQKSLAIGLDLRTRDFTSEKFDECVAHIRKHYPLTVVFLQADTLVLCARYRETRRGHPLGASGHIEELIEKEKSLLIPVKEHCDIIFDTSTLSHPEMRSQLQKRLSLPSQHLWVYLVSFSFRRNLPSQSDFVFDMRFLTNPHYDQSMRVLTGEHEGIQNYLLQQKDFSTFIDTTEALFSRTILPTYTTAHRLNCTISFGCTGGRHRSVASAELMAQRLRNHDFNVRVYHRDL